MALTHPSKTSGNLLTKSTCRFTTSKHKSNIHFDYSLVNKELITADNCKDLGIHISPDSHTGRKVKFPVAVHVPE